MTCKQCKYHQYRNGTHFCVSKNNKRRIVRISEKDAKKDIDCLWAYKVGKEKS